MKRSQDDLRKLVQDAKNQLEYVYNFISMNVCFEHVILC